MCRFLCHALVLIGVLSACDSSDPIPSANRWQVSPSVTIGVEAGQPAFEFGRITNAIQLSDGRIAVADHGNMEVRMFTPEGEHDRSLGRRGDGPGEFSSLTRLAVTVGDTLIAGGNSRLARFSPDGRFVSEERPSWSNFSRPPYHAEYIQPLADGSFILMLIESSAGQPDEQPLHRSTKMYFRAGGQRGTLDSLGVFPALEQMSYKDVAGMHTVIPLFPADTRLGVGRDHVVIGDLNADSILLYHLGSRRRSWIKLPLRRGSVPGPALEAARAKACVWASGTARDQCEADLQRLPAQAAYPAFRDIAVDSLGAVWVSSFPHPAVPDSSTWLVLDTTGRPIGSVILPSDLRITQIGESYILGVARDSVGVERVQHFALIRDS